jgi:hypothetical protein
MAKVPVIVVCSIICFMLGALAGAGGVTLFSPKLVGVRMTVALDKADGRPGDPAAGPGQGAGGMMGMGKGGGGGMMGGRMGDKGGGGMPGMGGKGGMPMMGKGGGMPGMGKGPEPKTQLESLIVKLDLLTQKPLKIDLSKEQAKKIADEVSKLKTAGDEVDAKEHLKTLLETLKDHKETLTAAGFRWPSAENGGQKGPGGGGPAVDLPKHLKSLEERFPKTEGK